MVTSTDEGTEMKATVYEMIVTNTITGAKMKAKMLVEDYDDDEAIGEIQSNFLWETFEFEVTPLESVELNDTDPVNTYSDVEAIS